MKQSFFITGALFLFLSSSVMSQTNETALLTKLAANDLYSITSEPVEKDYSALATTNFQKNFSHVKEAKWIEVAGRFRVNFTEKNILHVVDYTNKGKLYSVIRYGSELLSAGNRAMINTTFNNPTILEVAEVKMAGEREVVFSLVLEDKHSTKSVLIIGNDVQVVNEKSK